MFLDWIFYKQCFLCGKKIGKMTSFACENCSNILKYELCEYSVVHTLDKYFDELYSMFAYRKIIRKTIIDFKFNNKPYIGYLFASFMAEFLLVKKVRADMIIPVPIHYRRYKERGYNQSEILARFVGKKMNVEVNTKVLKKSRHSAKQSILTARERIKNVTNTFSIINKKYILGKTIMLIDDIYTTGATANECSRILKENGAAKVIVATIAHGKF